MIVELDVRMPDQADDALAEALRAARRRSTASPCARSSTL